MRDVFLRLGTDFLSTIIFLVIYLATDNIVLATSVAIAGAIGQVIYARIRGRPLHFMTWASLALVIVLGGATILTRDPRFVLAKPAIAHFTIGAIMRHGPHHSAQKSTTTGPVALSTSASKLASETLPTAIGIPRFLVQKRGDRESPPGSWRST